MHIVSVTEARNALRCPRLFALGRTRSVVAFPVGSSCLGSTFHRVMEQFAQAVHQAPRGGLLHQHPPAESLQRWILDLLVQTLDANPLFATLPAEVDDLAEACRQWATHVAQRLSNMEGPTLENLQKLIVSGEKSLDAFFPEADLTLRGRLDALYCDEAGDLEVVEYKLTDEANHSLDQAQVVLYRELLKRMNRQQAKPVILRFNPHLTRTALEPALADRLVQTELLALLQNMRRWIQQPQQAPPTAQKSLCAACPMLRACVSQYPQALLYRDEPPSNATRPRPDPSGILQASTPIISAVDLPDDKAGQQEAQAIRQKIIDELQKEGVSAEAADPVVGPSLYLIPVCRLRGPLSQLDRVADTVRNRLDFRDQTDVTYLKNGAKRQFVVKRKQPRLVALANLLAAKAPWLSERPGRFVVGQEPDGHILVGDLSDSATSHLLIGGQTGSGKSWLLKAIIASLVHFHDPAHLNLILIDPKRITFQNEPFLSAVSAHCERPVIFDSREAVPCFEQLVQLMEERYDRFASMRAEDLHDYNQRVLPSQRLARQVVVMDEFQDLTTDRQSAPLFLAAVDRLGAKARAAGIHLILATQRPDKDTVPSRIKSNLSGKIALKVANQINSRVILDQSGAEQLLGKGDLLADLGKGIVRAQAAVVG